MKAIKWTVAVALTGVLMLGGGCGQWKQKYQNCVQEKENCEGLLEAMQDQISTGNADKQRLADQLVAIRQQLRTAQEKAKKPKKTIVDDMGGRYDANKGTITMSLPSDILFNAGSATLKAAAKTKLKNIAKTIKQRYLGKKVSIVGHTDSDPIKVSKGKWRDNLDLSCDRAMAVTRYLITQGIPAKQLSAVGRGEHEPISKKKSENRRVEIIIHAL